MKKGLLQGIKVLDFSQVLSAPFCGMMLSDLGADVVKVERPGLGDVSRTAPISTTSAFTSASITAARRASPLICALPRARRWCWIWPLRRTL